MTGGQVEGRHACSRNPVANRIAQLSNRLAAQAAVSCQPRRLIRAASIGAMAPDAALRVYFPAFLENRRGSGRILSPHRGGTKGNRRRHACDVKFPDHAANNLRAFPSRTACLSESMNADSRTFNIDDSK